jgi:hypothetical protein
MEPTLGVGEAVVLWPPSQSGLQFLSGLLDMADQVRYIVYRLMMADCRSPELGFTSWI